MILFELTGRNEDHEVYRALQIANQFRQYGFLRSIVQSALEIQRPFLSQTVIKALNFHAIACLHTNAGEYRPCPVKVGEHIPPEHYRVNDLMDDFVNTVNRSWDSTNPISLTAYVLWRLNHIHPFVNGNGRTARAACYFVLCVKCGLWLRGTNILPELLVDNRNKYVCALRKVDAKFETRDLFLSDEAVSALQPLSDLILKLLTEQHKSRT